MKIKLSDFLSKVFKNVGIEQKDADMILAASSLKEIELPEDFETKFDTGYYTPDRAKSVMETELKPLHFGHFATDVERKALAPIIDSLPDEFKTKIAGLDKTNRIYNILKVVQEAYDHVKTSGSGEDVKKVNEKFRVQIEELNKSILDKDVTIKKKDEDFAKREGEIKTDYALLTKINSYKLAPEFEKRKDFIANLTLNSLKSKNLTVEFDKDNSQVIHLRQVKDGAITDVYEGNTKVTLDAFLEKELSDFTQKSNGGGNGNQNPPSNPQPSNSNQIPSDRSLTLQEMRANG